MNAKQNSYARMANKTRLLGGIEDPKANKWTQLIVELLAAGGGTLLGVAVPKASLVGLAGIVGSRFLEHPYASPAIRGLGYGLLLAPAVKSSDTISAKMTTAKQALLAKLPFDNGSNDNGSKETNTPGNTVAGLGAIEYFSYPETPTVEKIATVVRPMEVQQSVPSENTTPMDLLDYIELQLTQNAENHIDQMNKEGLLQTVQAYEISQSVTVSGPGATQADTLVQYLNTEAHNY